MASIRVMLLEKRPSAVAVDSFLPSPETLLDQSASSSRFWGSCGALLFDMAATTGTCQSYNDYIAAWHAL